MSKLPDWLPAEVVIHVQKLLNTGGLGVAKEPLCRLASDPEMAKVWGALQSRSKNPQELIEYLEYVRLHPIVMGWPTDLLNVPGDAVQSEMFDKVASSCQATLTALKELSYKKNNPQIGWGLLEQAVQRNERFSAETGDTQKLEAIANFQGHLQEIQKSSSVVEILEAIRLAALLAGDAPDMYLPRKRDSLKADRVLLAQDLSRYVHCHFHKPLHAVVASTINVALDFHEETLTPDAVRKLKHS